MLIWETTEFYRTDTPFYPIIQRDGKLTANTRAITLDAKLNSDLDWSSEIAQAESTGLDLFWEFDFDQIHLADPVMLQSQRLCLEHFNRQIWDKFQERTIGVCLGKIEEDLADSHLWDLELFEELLNSLSSAAIKDLFVKEHTLEAFQASNYARHHLRVFLLSKITEYWQYLLATLPEEINAFCLLDFPNSENLGEIAQLTSRERFTHLHLAVKNAPSMPGLNWKSGRALSGAIDQTDFAIRQPKVGLCIPPDCYCSRLILDRLAAAMHILDARGIDYRLISEFYLNEEWLDLQQIIVISTAVSTMGKRKLQGFCASSGQVVLLGESLNLIDEIDWEVFIDSKGKSE